MVRREDAGDGDGWVRIGSGGPGGDQLGQVVGSADERPLGLDLGEAAQKELAEVAGLLNLAEHGSTVCLRRR